MIRVRMEKDLRASFPEGAEEGRGAGCVGLHGRWRRDAGQSRARSQVQKL